MVSTKKELVNLLLAHTSEIHNYGVKKLKLFGSFARNEVTENSDIDIIVEFNEGQKSYKNFIGLVYYLETICGRKVELVTPKGLSKYFGKKIMNTAEDVLFSA